MPFFTYHQNNTFGEFDGPHYVIVEAPTAAEADYIAINHTCIYFDGCDDGRDCPCCGDRWYRAWGDGESVPMIYGDTLDATPYTNYMVRYTDGRVVNRKENN